MSDTQITVISFFSGDWLRLLEQQKSITACHKRGVPLAWIVVLEKLHSPAEVVDLRVRLASSSGLSVAVYTVVELIPDSCPPRMSKGRLDAYIRHIISSKVDTGFYMFLGPGEMMSEEFLPEQLIDSEKRVRTQLGFAEEISPSLNYPLHYFRVPLGLIDSRIPRNKEPFLFQTNLVRKLIRYVEKRETRNYYNVCCLSEDPFTSVEFYIAFLIHISGGISRYFSHKNINTEKVIQPIKIDSDLAHSGGQNRESFKEVWSNYWEKHIDEKQVKDSTILNRLVSHHYFYRMRKPLSRRLFPWLDFEAEKADSKFSESAICIHAYQSIDDAVIKVAKPIFKKSGICAVIRVTSNSTPKEIFYFCEDLKKYGSLEKVVFLQTEIPSFEWSDFRTSVNACGTDWEYIILAQNTSTSGSITDTFWHKGSEIAYTALSRFFFASKVFICSSLVLPSEGDFEQVSKGQSKGVLLAFHSTMEANGEFLKELPLAYGVFVRTGFSKNLLKWMSRRSSEKMGDFLQTRESHELLRRVLELGSNDSCAVRDCGPDARSQLSLSDDSVYDTVRKKTQLRKKSWGRECHVLYRVLSTCFWGHSFDHLLYLSELLSVLENRVELNFCEEVWVLGGFPSKSLKERTVQILEDFDQVYIDLNPDDCASFAPNTEVKAYNSLLVDGAGSYGRIVIVPGLLQFSLRQWKHLLQLTRSMKVYETSVIEVSEKGNFRFQEFASIHNSFGFERVDIPIFGSKTLVRVKGIDGAMLQLDGELKKSDKSGNRYDNEKPIDLPGEGQQADLINNSTCIYVLIPLKHKSSESDWLLILENLRDTLRSIHRAGAHVSHWKAVLICSNMPDIEEVKSEHVKVLLVDPIKEDLDLKQRFQQDRNRRERLGAVWIREHLANDAAAYIVNLDADDLLHRDLFSYVARDDNRRGYVLDKGYVLDCEEKVLKMGSPIFQYCGSSFIGYFKKGELPRSFEDEDCYYSSFLHHRSHLRHSIHTGRWASTLPFPALAYKVNHPESVMTLKSDDQKKKKAKRNLFVFRESSSTEVCEKLLQEFFID